MSWQQDAACLDVDPDMFFDGTRQTEALKVCGGCAVREQCLQLVIGLSAVDDYGVFAGTSPHGRTKIRAGLAAAQPRAPRPARYCEVRDCGGKHKAKGMCDSHYTKWRAEENLRLGIARLCKVDGCKRVVTARDKCRVHYGREYRAKQKAA